MLKRGHLFKSWKNRFFVMQGHVVKYFSDKVDVDETVPPSLLLGILKVESISLGCSDIYAPSTTLGPDEVCTSIGASSSSSSYRTLYLSHTHIHTFYAHRTLSLSPPPPAERKKQVDKMADECSKKVGYKTPFCFLMTGQKVAASGKEKKEHLFVCVQTSAQMYDWIDAACLSLHGKPYFKKRK